MRKTITRVWHGVVPASKSEEYLQYVIQTGVDDYKAIPGNLSVNIWRRTEGDRTHFWTVTTWDSFESIRQFAGEDFEKAKYYPKDEDYLLEFEPTVIHCETFEM